MTKLTSKVLEQLDLAQCTLREDLLAEDIGHLLDSDPFPGVDVRCSADPSHFSAERCMRRRGSGRRDQTRHVPDDAIGTLPQLLGHVISLIHSKVLVEDLEDLATLRIRHGRGWCGRQRMAQAEGGWFV